MEIDPALMAELLAGFADEMREQSAAITSGLLELEADPAQVSADVLAAMFRSAHNIKGSARSLGLGPLGDLAHRLENVLDSLRSGAQQVDSSLADPCLTAVDAMPEVLAALRDGDEDRAQFVAARASVGLFLITGDPPGPLPVGAPASESGYTAQPSREAQPPQPQVVQDPSEGTADIVDPAPAEADPTGSDGGQVGASARPARIDSRNQEVIRIGLHRFERVQSLAESVFMAKIALADQYEEFRSLHEKAETLLADWSRTLTGLPPETPAEVRPLLQSVFEQASGLRSDLGAFDQLLHGLTRQLSMVSDSLRDELHHVRLEPVAAVLEQLRRPVRDTARSLQRRVDLEFSGADVEADRVVLDALRDPLIHLVRNAIDHGIEDADERIAAGKPERATIRIDVSATGGEVQVRLSDDGRGVSRDTIAAAAERSGLVSQNELSAMADNDVLDLMFRPGFSTRQEVSDISGRGVGLDVVRSALGALGGSVTVDSLPGSGTHFLLRFPLTVANESAVLVQVGEERLAVPITAIQRVLLVDPADVRSIAGSRAIVVSDKVVSLVSLGAVLGLPGGVAADRGQLQVVVLAKGADEVAFEVDEILGQREILVKPLGYPFRSVHNVSGGSLTGRGDVIVVLNPFDLVDQVIGGAPASFGIASDAERGETPDTMLDPVRSDSGSMRILVAEDTYTTRTLEVSILRSAGFQVDAAVDGEDAWGRLDQGHYDLLVTDIDMPRLTGLELTARIRAHSELSHVPIVVVSARDSELDRQRGAEAGADAYLTKSAFHTGDLLEAVRDLLPMTPTGRPS